VSYVVCCGWDEFTADGRRQRGGLKPQRVDSIGEALGVAKALVAQHSGRESLEVFFEQRDDETGTAGATTWVHPGADVPVPPRSLMATWEARAADGDPEAERLLAILRRQSGVLADAVGPQDGSERSGGMTTAVPPVSSTRRPPRGRSREHETW
jgi:hypothetical protein